MSILDELLKMTLVNQEQKNMNDLSEHLKSVLKGLSEKSGFQYEVSVDIKVKDVDINKFFTWLVEDDNEEEFDKRNKEQAFDIVDCSEIVKYYENKNKENK